MKFPNKKSELLVSITQEHIDEAYTYHEKIWWMCADNNPLALALKCRVDYSCVLLGREEILLPPKARDFMLRFGYSLYGRQSKRSFETAKALHKSSSNYDKPILPSRMVRVVKPFEFVLER